MTHDPHITPCPVGPTAACPTDQRQQIPARLSDRQQQPQRTTVCFSGQRQRPQRTVCFSGHRYYTGTEEDEARLAAALEAAWTDGYRTFISGMAPGFDLAAAEAVVRLRNLHPDNSRNADSGRNASSELFQSGIELRSIEPIRLIAAIPFARQATGYSPADRARYETLVAAADEVYILAERYSHGCYFRRDDWMVERAARIICWYDGGNGHRNLMRTPEALSRLTSRRNTGSGTRYTVRRAVAYGLEVVNLFRPAGMLFQ